MRDSPSVGDESFSVLSRTSATENETVVGHGDLWLVVLRKGNVLGAVLVHELVTGAEQAFTESDVAAIANAAAARLP